MEEKKNLKSESSDNQDLKNQQVDNSNEKKRYSKEELEEFRVIIEEKLESAKKDLEMLRENFKCASDNDTADTSPTFKVLEEGQTVLSKEENGRLAMRQEKFIDSLEQALIRIDNGTYGICRVTGKLIPKERLRSVPHATLSVEGKMLLQEREKRQNKL